MLDICIFDCLERYDTRHSSDIHTLPLPLNFLLLFWYFIKIFNYRIDRILSLKGSNVFFAPEMHLNSGHDVAIVSLTPPSTWTKVSNWRPKTNSSGFWLFKVHIWKISWFQKIWLGHFWKKWFFKIWTMWYGFRHVLMVQKVQASERKHYLWNNEDLCKNIRCYKYWNPPCSYHIVPILAQISSTQ